MIPGRVPGDVSVLTVHPEDPGSEEELRVTGQLLVAHNKGQSPDTPRHLEIVFLLLLNFTFRSNTVC